MNTIFRDRVEALGFDFQTVLNEMEDGDLVYSKYGMETFNRPYECNKLAGAIRMHRVYSLVKPNIDTWLSKADLRPDVAEFISANKKELESYLDWKNDFTYGNLAAATLINTYLAKNGTDVYEVPQLMILRVAVGAGVKRGIEFIKETISLFNERKLSLATPILLNMGFKRKAPTSCMVMVMDDSIEDIYDCLKEIAVASKGNAGIGLSLAKLRHSQIANEGESKGIMPLMHILDRSIEYVDQGGKRPGAACAALPIWHYDIYDFIMCKDKLKQDRIRRLNTNVLLNDLFMERVKADGDWYCVCPKISGLAEVHGKEFEELYLEIEKRCIAGEIRYRKYNARDLLSYICDQQRKSGMPFINHIDTINRSNPNDNVGMIYSLNLCQEIALPSIATKQTATCNIGAVCLKTMFKDNKFDFPELIRSVKHLCLFLNDVLDHAHNIQEKAKRSNDLIRPIAIGVNGWAELLYNLNLCTADDTLNLIEDIWGCIYYSALSASCDEADKFGPYKMFGTSKYVNGLDYKNFCDASAWGGDWKSLSDRVKLGLRNSTLTAQMPTATSAQILEATESDEIGENMVVRRLTTGDYVVQNYHLVEDLKKIKMWTPQVHAQILDDDGSIQGLPECRREMEHIKLKYRTVWEIPQKHRIKEQSVRQKYTDQARSFNLFLEDPKKNMLMMTHYDIWKSGLKSSYYVRSKSFTKNKKFNVDACKACEL